MKPPTTPGLMLILSAPSGAGKTTLARRLVQNHPEAAFSVSYTTRQPRGAEKEAVDYHFVDVLTFKSKIENGEFVEWAEVHGHFYGSSQSVVDKALSTNGLAIFDIDVQGGQAIKAKYPESVLTFILPPSMEELERRLRGRGTDSDETIHKRLLGARAEMERGVANYDYVVFNESFDRAYEELEAIMRAEWCRRGRVDLSKLKL